MCKTWLSTFETVSISMSFGGDIKSRRSVAEISIWRLATKYVVLDIVGDTDALLALGPR